jgi:CubicO group peptidase (beta-lactamase class C family)
LRCFESGLLDGFRLRVAEKQLGVYGIHLYKEGYAPLQFRFRSDDRTHLFSGSKAFTSVAVGIAIGEGRISMADAVLSFFPEFAGEAAQGAEKITVRDLLQMRAGHGGMLYTTHEQSQYTGGDWAKRFLSMPAVHPAGTRFLYDNGCSYMLSRVLEKATGETLKEYLVPRLFDPLGIPNPQWHTCPDGHTLGATGLFLSTEEFSRLGRLLLFQGEWEGKELVPADYIRQAAEDTVTVEGFGDPENQAGYGYQLWGCTCGNAYRADGKFGQYSVVFPQQRAVVTITAHNEGVANDILRAIYDEVIPRLPDC